MYTLFVTQNEQWYSKSTKMNQCELKVSFWKTKNDTDKLQLPKDLSQSGCDDIYFLKELDSVICSL